MNHLGASCTCTECGGSLICVNSAKPSRTESLVTLACTCCRVEFLVRMQMVAFGRYEPTRRTVAA